MDLWDRQKLFTGWNTQGPLAVQTVLGEHWGNTRRHWGSLKKSPENTGFYLLAWEHVPQMLSNLCTRPLGKYPLFDWQWCWQKEEVGGGTQRGTSENDITVFFMHILLKIQYGHAYATFVPPGVCTYPMSLSKWINKICVCEGSFHEVIDYCRWTLASLKKLLVALAREEKISHCIVAHN